MVVLDGNFVVGCGPAWNRLQLNTYISMYARTDGCYNVRPGTDHPYIRIFQCMLERTGAVTYVDCRPGTDYPYIDIFQCMLERTITITNVGCKPGTVYPTYIYFSVC